MNKNEICFNDLPLTAFVYVSKVELLLDRTIRAENFELIIDCLPYLLIAAVPLIFAFISYLIDHLAI